jgi:hypothetical protein
LSRARRFDENNKLGKRRKIGVVGKKEILIMVMTLAVFGGAIMAALVFRFSGITSVEWRGFRITANEKPPKQIK